MEAKKDEIRISTNAMIALVVTEAEEREMAAMPSLKEMNEAFHPSEQFQQKMGKLLRTARNKERNRQWSRVAKRVAVCFMILVTLFTGIMMPVQAVREAVVTTLLEWRDKFLSVSFLGSGSENRTLPEKIELGYIPKEMILQGPVVKDESYFCAEYIGDEEFFTIQVMSIDNQLDLGIDNERTSHYLIHFDSYDVIWTTSNEEVNTLVWSDGNLGYHISGNLDLAILLQIAQNIKKIETISPDFSYIDEILNKKGWYVMKKIVRFILPFVLMSALLCTTAFAAQPRWANVTSIVSTMYASTGSYSSTIDGVPGTTKIECTLTLYEKNWLGNYVEVSHLTETYNGRFHVFKGYYDIQAGKTYKLVTDAIVTKDGVAETVSFVSEKKC